MDTAAASVAVLVKALCLILNGYVLVPAVVKGYTVGYISVARAVRLGRTELKTVGIAAPA